MVSFTCNYCQDVVKKPKVVGHANTCGSKSFTCVDCMEVFDTNTIKGHTSCVTETEKYQGKWRQKVEAPRKRPCENNGGSDDDMNPKGRHTLRPTRPPMDFDSDSDDDDTWISSKKKNPLDKVPSGSVVDDNNDGKSLSVAKKPKGESPMKRAKVETSPKLDVPSNKKKNNTSNGKRESLELPRAMTASDCVVPSFVLGTDEELANVAGWIFQEAGLAAMDAKTLSKKMVERYNVRIAKYLREALEAAVRNGKLRRREEDGMLTL